MVNSHPRSQADGKNMLQSKFFPEWILGGKRTGGEKKSLFFSTLFSQGLGYGDVLIQQHAPLSAMGLSTPVPSKAAAEVADTKVCPSRPRREHK